MFRSIRAFALVFATVVLVCLPQIRGQESGRAAKPLTEADLVALIGRQADDQALVRRLDKHKLAFTLDEATFARVKQANPSPAVLAALSTLLPVQAVQPVQPPAGKGGWTVQKSGVEDDLLDVAFLNEKVGVAVGKHQTIVRTTDGGKTWARAIERVKDGPNLGTVLFANDKLGYAITRGLGTILHTNDGGATWAKMPFPDAFGRFPSGFCTHAVHGSSYYYLGWGSTGTALLKTENAGRTWVKIKTKPELKLGVIGDTGFAFPDGKNGCFVNTQASEFIFNWGVTQDDGRTWDLDKFKDKVRRGTSVRLQFVDKDRGWFRPMFDATIYATTDGGKTWAPQKISKAGTSNMVNLHFANAKVGQVLFGDQDDAVWQTSDGGKTWASLGDLRQRGLNGLNFPSAQIGWIVGNGGFINHYSARNGMSPK